jgi:serine/threonine protein kinase
LEIEYYEGGNLARWFAGKGGAGSIGREVRLQLMIRIARAVAVAHSIGVIHKNIKPSNIFIVEEGGGPRAAEAESVGACGKG